MFNLRVGWKEYFFRDMFSSVTKTRDLYFFYNRVVLSLQIKSKNYIVKTCHHPDGATLRIELGKQFLDSDHLYYLRPKKVEAKFLDTKIKKLC